MPNVSYTTILKMVVVDIPEFTYSLYGTSIYIPLRILGLPILPSINAEFRVEIDSEESGQVANAVACTPVNEQLTIAGKSSRSFPIDSVLGAFAFDAGQKAITCRPRGNPNSASFRHLLLNQVIPLAMSCGSRMVLHSSGLVSEQGAIGLVGHSGNGKSTLCSALLQTGCQLLTDDVLVLLRESTEYAAMPGYPEVRLWPDTARAIGDASQPSKNPGIKESFPTEKYSFHHQPAPLKRIYYLRTRPDVAIEPMSSAQALTSILEHSLRLNVDGQEGKRNEFTKAADLAARPIHRILSYPRSYSLLPRVCEAVLQDLARDG